MTVNLKVSPLQLQQNTSAASENHHKGQPDGLGPLQQPSELKLNPAKGENDPSEWMSGKGFNKKVSTSLKLNPGGRGLHMFSVMFL